MKPENVNPSNFKVEKVLLNSFGFSIAYGLWDKESNRLGMRWNGENENDPGYPKLFSNPVWFMIPEELSIPLTKALLDIEGVEKETILETLSLQYRE